MKMHVFIKKYAECLSIQKEFYLATAKEKTLSESKPS